VGVLDATLSLSLLSVPLGIAGADIYCKRKTVLLEAVVWDVIAAAILAF
jgi:hypothetical protein